LRFIDLEIREMMDHRQAATAMDVKDKLLIRAWKGLWQSDALLFPAKPQPYQP
jgi:hypothetical protein